MYFYFHKLFLGTVIFYQIIVVDLQIITINDSHIINKTVFGLKPLLFLIDVRCNY